jgi:hypothetical protein
VGTVLKEEMARGAKGGTATSTAVRDKEKLSAGQTGDPSALHCHEQQNGQCISYISSDSKRAYTTNAISPLPVPKAISRARDAPSGYLTSGGLKYEQVLGGGGK